MPKHNLNEIVEKIQAIENKLKRVEIVSWCGIVSSLGLIVYILSGTL